ncbi:MAG: FAD-dependent oxidoreductase [Thermomicrobiales bacterium]|nr:FAD-dependent oxidoreductase [Thermomicrobiales bacterium]
MDDRFDAIVVGAGPAGIAAAREMAEAGLAVVVLERGQYPGAKNVSGGILYRHPTEEIIPGFEAEAPLERPIIEQRYLALTADAMLGGIYRTQDFGSPPFNSYSVLRSEFDRWYATKAEEAGAEVYPEFTVTDLIFEKGKVVGVSTGEPDGELLAHVVVLADGANSLLAKQAGLHTEWNPIDQALVAKELIALQAGTINDRFQLPDGLGAAYEIFGESTWNHLGYGFIYTNKESLSIGTGALLQDLIDSGHNVNDMLDRFKKHPAITPLIAGGETIEYSAHLIPEFGYNKLPKLFADGVLVVGDAAGLVNPINREGANLAMISGKLAGQTVISARERDDSSITTLVRYRELLEESIVLQDLYKVRNTTHFAHERPHLLVDYPDLVSKIAKTYLTVDGASKKAKMAEINRLVRSLPKRRLIDDAIGGFRSMFR